MATLARNLVSRGSLMSSRALTRIPHALLLVIALCAGSPAFAQPVEASNLPANLRPLIPPG